MADKPTTTKLCKTCGAEKPKTDFLGRNALCKICLNARDRLRAAANRDHIRARAQAWKLANPDKVKAGRVRQKENIRIRNAEYRSAHPDELRAYIAKWRAENKEKIVAKRLADRAKNGDIIRQREHALRSMRRPELAAKAAERRLKFPNQYAATAAKYRAANPGKGAAFREANPDLNKVYCNRRRARRMGVAGSFTKTDIADIRLLQRDKCGGCRIALKGKGAVDHILALVKGGSNNRRNLQLLCRSCNSRKNSRDAIVFMQSRGFLI